VPISFRSAAGDYGFVRNIRPTGAAMVGADWSILSKKMESSPDYNHNCERLSMIGHLMFDKASVRYYAVLRLNTLLGISERYHPVPWTTLAP
jgi:hypothetical protein